MNDHLILKKDHTLSLLRRLMREHRLVAPLRNRHGDTLFSEVEDLAGAELDLEHQPQASLKPFLFPQQETMFRYRLDGEGGYRFEPPDPGRPLLFFGVRACDLSAVLYLDVIFSKRGRDPYYFARRRDSLLISLACNQPFANCFCNSAKTGPFLEYGFDLQLTDLGDRYLVEVGRARGAELVGRWRHFFTPAEEADRKAQYQALLESRSHFQRQVHLEQAIRRLQADEPLPEELWAGLSRRCQDCGGCAYVCPTCTCFTITDQQITATEGLRQRSWDACTFGGFTRLAGGHNPVDPGREAVRQRFLHKLLYDVREHGRPSCVGCGRCVGICFGGVDIVRFIDLVCEVRQ